MPSDSPLTAILEQEIRARGAIPFTRFMELCLYHPQHGYYNSERVKLGAAGDFYTSAHVRPVFARILARHWERLWRDLGRPARFDLVELGPGDGALAREVLEWVRQAFRPFFASLRYTAVEQSARLRERLQVALTDYADRAEVVADFPGRVDETASPGICGCIFANEFFDALPVHILVWRQGRWRERLVALAKDKLVWRESDPSSPGLLAEAELRFDPTLPVAERPNGWVAEASPAAAEWMRRIGQALGRGELLIVDYGYTLEEWRQGRFPEGSAISYRNHRVVEHLLGDPGDQDLTAHVNLTGLIEAGQQAGLGLGRLESQAKFLMK